VEFAPTANPFDPIDTMEWEDISRYVLSVKWRRGKQHELDQVQAGTATITLNNAAGAIFCPWNKQSPYWHGGLGLTPMRPLGRRVRPGSSATVSWKIQPAMPAGRR